jgi:hypothetical protein
MLSLILFNESYGQERDILMRNSQPDDDNTDAGDFDVDLNATHLISDARHPKEASLIEVIELKPTEQQHIPLGTFKESNPPKGFSVEITPDPDPADSVLTDVVSIGTSKQYKLVMQITNYSIGNVVAEVWQS